MFQSVSIRISIAVTEHHVQKISGERKGFFLLTILNCSSLLKEVRRGAQTGQDPGNWS